MTHHPRSARPTPDAGRAMELRRGPVWPNRLALAPLTNQQSNDDGSLHDDELSFLRRRAEGGFGVVMTCAAHVAAAGKAFPGQLGVGLDDYLPGLTRLASALHEHKSVALAQLHHAGLRASPAVSGVPRVGPWDDRERGVRALTTAEVQETVESFARAAARVEQAGFDGVEVHGAHGYLLAEFLDPTKNTRTDGYGGSFRDRSRIFFDVLEAVRRTTGPDFQVGIRLSPLRWGIVLEEALSLAEQIMASGLVEFVDMSMWDVQTRSPAANGSDETLTQMFTALPRHGTRMGVAGKILSGAAVGWCLEQGADFVLVGAGAILHHDFAEKVLADQSFVSVERPVTREHLAAEAVSPQFIDYITSMWDDFVS